ncbi:MAG: hypothetical protein Kow00109_12580 [Acidobacteriota bacterium]
MGLFKKKVIKLSKKPDVTHKVPLVPFKVLQTGIPFYRDPECTQRVPDATLMVLQALDPEDEVQEYDIVPTTLEYKVGDYVTLGFENKRLWEDCYYRDPETGEIRKAWKIHVDFIGDVIAPEAVEKERDRIRELERRVQEKIEEIARRKAEEEPEAVH